LTKYIFIAKTGKEMRLIVGRLLGHWKPSLGPEDITTSSLGVFPSYLFNLFCTLHSEIVVKIPSTIVFIVTFRASLKTYSAQMASPPMSMISPTVTLGASPEL
jgi:hypothetical protein